MIQRIQSLYLLLATLLYILLFFFPFAEYTTAGKTYELTVLGVMDGDAVYQRGELILAGVILLMVFPFTIIFLYKKRMLQSRLTAICLLLNVGLIAGMFFYSDSIANKLEASAHYTYSTYIVMVPLIFLWLANRAIRKDELKVRAADRLR